MTVTESPPRLAEQPEPPAIDYPEDGSVAPVRRFGWAPVEVTPVPDEPSPHLHGRHIAVIGGTNATASSIQAVLEGAGAITYRLSAAADTRTVDAQVQHFREMTSRLDGIVDLNLEQAYTATPLQWELPMLQTMSLLQSCYPDWVAEADAQRLFYVAITRLGGQMGFSDATMTQPLGGLWAGLAKGLPREIPNCNVRVLDIADELAGNLPQILSHELYRWGLYEVGYHGGHRYSLVADHRPVGPARLSLDAGDVVAFTGGGRGIGFSLARALARDYGVRVILSGRQPRPDPRDPLITMPGPEFRRYRDEQLRQAAVRRTLAITRAELDRLSTRRELAANLAVAAAEGLQIEYVPCDVSDADAVAGLLGRAGDRLVGVIHNAGIDLPARLPAKTLDAISRVIRVKIEGFANVVAALRDRIDDVRFVCSVGSLTGRLGGMVGQLDYGAANEGLSRMGLWAAQGGPQPGRAGSFPVTTVCWPTWERLGMITNYEATLAYMSAVDVTEGLYHWQRELLAGTTGEATFIGPIGPSMSPSVLHGYPQDAAVPDAERLASSRWWLGEPVHFRPNLAIGSRNRFDIATMPGCLDVRIGGEPSLPVSLVLELLNSTGPWTQPERRASLRQLGMRDVWINLAGLRAGRSPTVLDLTKTAQGRWSGDSWLIATSLRLAGCEVARAELVYANDAASWLPSGPPPAMGTTRPLPAGEGIPGVIWTGQAYRMRDWTTCPETGYWLASAPPESTTTLLADVPAPAAELPLHAIENVVRGILLRQVDELRGTPSNVLTASRIAFAEASEFGGGSLIADPGGAFWTAWDARGHAYLRIEEPQLSRPPTSQER